MLVFMKKNFDLNAAKKIIKSKKLLLKSSSLPNIESVYGKYGKLKGLVTSLGSPQSIEPGSSSHADVMAKLGTLQPTGKRDAPLPAMIIRGAEINPFLPRVYSSDHESGFSRVATHLDTGVKLSQQPKISATAAEHAERVAQAQIEQTGEIAPPVGLPEKILEKFRAAKSRIAAHMENIQGIESASPALGEMLVGHVGGSAFIKRDPLVNPVNGKLQPGAKSSSNFIPVMSFLKHPILKSLRVNFGRNNQPIGTKVDENDVWAKEKKEAERYARTLTDPGVLETVKNFFVKDGMSKHMIRLHRAIPRLGIFLSHGILHGDSLEKPAGDQSQKLPFEKSASQKRQEIKKQFGAIVDNPAWGKLSYDFSTEEEMTANAIMEDEPNIEEGERYSQNLKAEAARSLIRNLQTSLQKSTSLNQEEKNELTKLLRTARKSADKYGKSLGMLIRVDSPNEELIGRTFVAAPFEQTQQGDDSVHSFGFPNPRNVSKNWMTTTVRQIKKSGLSDSGRKIFREHLEPFFLQWTTNPLTGTEQSLIDGSLKMKQSLIDAWSQLDDKDKEIITRAFRLPSGRSSFYHHTKTQKGSYNPYWMDRNSVWSHNPENLSPLMMSEDQNLEMDEEKAKNPNIGVAGWSNFQKIRNLILRQLRIPGRVQPINPFSGDVTKIVIGSSPPTIIAGNVLRHIPVDAQETGTESAHESRSYLQAARKEGDPETMPFQEVPVSSQSSEVEPHSNDIANSKSILFKLFPRRPSLDDKFSEYTNGTMLGQVNFNSDFTSCSVAIFHEFEEGKDPVKIGQIEVSVPEHFYDPCVINKQNKANLQNGLLMRNSDRSELIFGKADVDRQTGDIIGIPSDKQFVTAIQYLRTHSDTSAQMYDVSKRMVDAWRKSNDDASYCILMERHPNIFNLDEDREYKERVRARYFIDAANRASKINQNEDFTNTLGQYLGLEPGPNGEHTLSHIEPMDVLQKLISENKTRQDKIVEIQAKINTENMADNESDKTIKYQGIYNFARSLTEELMAQHAAFEHLNAALALHASDTPLMADSQTGKLINEPQRLQPGPNNNPYGILVGLAGSAENPTVIANQAKVPVLATTIPDNVTPEFALPLLARLYQAPIQQPGAKKRGWMSALGRAWTQWWQGDEIGTEDFLTRIDNLDQGQIKTVEDQETRKFADKPTVADGWKFPICLNEDDHGSLFFFGNKDPEENPITTKQDLLNLVNERIKLIDENSGIVIANKRIKNDDDNAASVFMKKNDNSQVPSARFNNSMTAIIIDGCGFLAKYDNPMGRYSFVTQSNGKIQIPIVSKRDSNGLVKYHLDMSPIRKEAQILSHAMENENTVGNQEEIIENFNENAVQNVFRTILGQNFNKVPELSIATHGNGISNLDQVARHGGVTHKVISRDAMQAFQQETGWTIDPNIRQFFDKSRRTQHGSDDMRIVAMRGSVAIVMIPTARQIAQYPSDVDSIRYLNNYMAKLLSAENKDYSEKEFGRRFGIHYGSIPWDYFADSTDVEETSDDGSSKSDRNFFSGIQLGSGAQTDAKPGNYKKLDEVYKQAEETVAAPIQFVVVDLRNANQIFEKPQDGRSLKVGDSVKIINQDIRSGENKRVIAGTETEQATEDLERWQMAKKVNDAETLLIDLFPFANTGNFNSLANNSNAEMVLRQISSDTQGNYSLEQKEAAKILLDNKTLQEPGFPENIKERTKYINENFEESEKNFEKAKKQGYQDTIYPINSENVLFKISAKQLNSSYVYAIDQVIRIANAINEGTIGKDFINQRSEIEKWEKSATGNPQDSLGVVLAAMEETNRFFEQRQANNDPVQSVTTDGVSSNMQTRFFIKERVFVLPDFASLNGKAKDLPKAAMSPQDIKKSIGNFSSDLVELIEDLGIRIVIHSGNRESVESLNPNIDKSTFVNRKNTTWMTADNTIFLGTRSENPMQDLLRCISIVFADSVMSDQNKKMQAKANLDRLISSRGNSRLEEFARTSLTYDPTQTNQMDESIKKYLQIFFQNRFSHNAKYHNFGGFLKEYQSLGEVDHPWDDLEKPISPSEDTGVRASPTTTSMQTRQILYGSLFLGLNKKQRMAMESDGPTVIEGIPGAGKTEMLVSKMIDTILTKKVDAKKILAFTFTRASADNLMEKFMTKKQQVASMANLPRQGFVDDDDAIPCIGTMHSVALRWIRGEKKKDPLLKIDGFNWDKNKNVFTKVDIIGENQSQNMIKSIMEGLTEAERQEVDEDGNRWTPQSVSSKLATLKDSEKSVYDEQSTLLKKVSSIYEEELSRKGLTDYSGLLQKVADHLSSNKDARKIVQEKYSHIMVDEFQDTNNVQMRILKSIVPIDGGHLTVVGDKMQAIYGFRGGNSKFIDKDFFAKLYPNTTFIKLDQNYRSNDGILDVAGVVEQAAGVDRTIIPNSIGKINNKVPSDTPLAKMLAKKTIVNSPPVEIFKGHGKLSQMEYVARQIRSLTGVLQGKVDDKTGINAIAILCRTRQEVDQVERFLKQNGIKVKPRTKDPTIEEQILGYNMAGESPDPEKEEPGIVVTTLHQSKGLEYPAVFIYNASSSSFPTVRSMRDSSESPEAREEAIQEERRLFYTGITRAECRLFLTTEKKHISPFVSEIEQGLQYRRGIINVNHEKK